ncbi:MAG: winged helix-turn-helix domain-containing protein [Sedimenticolaceae bacterium]
MTVRSANILIVDDEAPIREMVDFALSADGIGCVGAATIAEAEARIAKAPPDLILLDWMLSRGESGLDFMKRLRTDDWHRAIPIIMLTARDSSPDKVAALDAGADDHISKPFSPSELKARIHAVLRRCAPVSAKQLHNGETITVCGLHLDLRTRRVTADGKPIELGPTEFRLLHFLMRHQERVYSRSELIGYVWPPNTYVEERTVDVHIRNLRRALQASGRRQVIQTVRSVGYRFSVC